MPVIALPQHVGNAFTCGMRLGIHFPPLYLSRPASPPPLLPRLLVGPFPGMPCELTGMEVE